MKHDPKQTLIYHITDVANLAGILADGGVHSDATMAARNPTVIGYVHIKERRLKEIRVPCCGNRFVGEFVPFYFCPRSPMLFAINKGNAGRPPGCQSSIIHLVSTMAAGIATGRAWAVSSGNAGATHATYSAQVQALDALDWNAIRTDQWKGMQHQKAAEFLLADFFPWHSIESVGCANLEVARQVSSSVQCHSHCTLVEVKQNWYY